MSHILDLHEQFCQYCLHIKNYRKSTIKGYKGAIKVLINRTGLQNIQDMAEPVIRNFFFQGRMEYHWSSHTFIDYRKSLIVFFEWCVKNQLIRINPIKSLEKPKLEKTLPKNLALESAFRVLEITLNYPYSDEFIRRRNHAIMATFIFSGLRKDELLNLRFMDIDFRTKTIMVRQGKGAKDRVIPLLVDLEIILQRYVDERMRLKKTCPEFFASFNRNKGYTDSGLKRLVSLISKGSGINFHCHMLRHTFATLMLQGGCDIVSLSKMMGHSDVKTTMIYLGVSVEHLRKEMIKHPLQILKMEQSAWQSTK